MSEGGQRKRESAVSAGEEADDLVIVARGVKTRGVRGEIAADLLTDFPERFAALTELIAVSPAGERQRLPLEASWLHGERVVLKFAGYDSIEEASALIGSDFAVPEAERVGLEEGEFYDWELEGCRVETVEGREIGRVREVLPTGGVPVLVIEGQEGREHLLPLAETICVEIDVKAKLIRADAPAGLLEL